MEIFTVQLYNHNIRYGPISRRISFGIVTEMITICIYAIDTPEYGTEIVRNEFKLTVDSMNHCC